MIKRYLGTSDQPLDSKDLDICQRAFDEAKTRLRIEDGTAECGQLGAMIVTLYRQGVCDVTQLVAMVGAARDP